LFFPLVSSGREFQKSFPSPAARPAAPFHGILKKGDSHRSGWGSRRTFALVSFFKNLQ
jgi:hypothetical protein